MHVSSRSILTDDDEYIGFHLKTLEKRRIEIYTSFYRMKFELYSLFSFLLVSIGNDRARTSMISEIIGIVSLRQI
jgi:hypothetical protein